MPDRGKQSVINLAAVDWGTLWIPLNNFSELLLNDWRENFDASKNQILFPSMWCTGLLCVCFVCSGKLCHYITCVYPCVCMCEHCLLFTRADRDNREANFNKSKQFPPSASRFPILAGRAHKTKQSKKSAVHFPLTICLWIPILWDIAPPFLFESTKPDAGYHLPHSSLNWLHVWKSHKASLTYGQCSIFTTMQCICSYPTRF